VEEYYKIRRLIFMGEAGSDDQTHGHQTHHQYYSSFVKLVFFSNVGLHNRNFMINELLIEYVAGYQLHKS
jgi:hypothetical protein